MPARSVKAQPDAELKGEIATLKQRVSELDNANNKLSMDLGAAQSDLKAYARLKVEHESLGNALKNAQTMNLRLNADLNSAAAKGGRDGNQLAAAKQLAEAVKTLSGS